MRRLAWIFPLALALALLVWLAGRSDSPAPSAVAPPTLPPALAPAAEVPAPASTPSREVEPAPSVARPSHLRGQVVGADTRLALAAEIALAGVRSFTDESTGEFDLALGSGSAERLELRARGYTTRVLESAQFPASGELGTLALDPAGSVTIEVVEQDGRPCPDALVLCVPPLAFDPTKPAPSIRELGKTDSKGQVVLGLARRVILASRKGGRWSAAIPWYPGEEGVKLVLAVRSTPLVGVRELDTNLPLPDTTLVAIPLASPARSSFVARTAADGVAFDSLPPGRYSVRTLLEGVELVSRKDAPQAAEDAARGPLAPIVIDVAEGGDPIWLPATNLPRRFLEVRDAHTKAALERCSILTELYSDVPGHPDLSGWYRNGPPIPLEARGGRFALAQMRLDGYEANENLRIVASAPGYQTAALVDPRHAIPKDGSATLFLEPIAARDLRLVDSADAPYRQTVWIREAVTKSLLARAEPSSSGIVPALGIPPEGIVICGSSDLDDVVGHPESSASGGPLLARIATGAVLVHLGGQDPADVRCERRGRACYRGTRSGYGLLFASLPVGAYAIGTREELDLLPLREAQGLPNYDVAVHEGATTQVDLRSESNRLEHAGGTVMCVGIDPARLRVIPFFGSADCPIPGGGVGAQFPVRANGSFELWDLPRRPTRLVFGITKPDGEWLTLGLGTVEGPNEVRCARIEVQFKPGACQGNASILWSVQFGETRIVDLLIEHGSCEQGVTLDPAPEAVNSIRVFADNVTQTLKVDLRAGTTTRLVVGPDK